MSKAVAAGAHPSALFLLLFLTVAPLSAQVSFTWDAHVATESVFEASSNAEPPGQVDLPGASLDIRDVAELRMALHHGAGRGSMVYSLSGRALHVPLGGFQPEFTDRVILAYPAESGMRYELPPRRRNGMWFAAELGRVELTEPSGILFESPHAVETDQLADALVLEFRYPRMYWSVAAGYLGLVDKFASNVRLTQADHDALSNGARYGGANRGVAVTRVESTSLFWNQDLGGLFVGQVEFGDRSSFFDSWYFGPVVQGPIWSAPGVGTFRHKSSAIFAVPVQSGVAGGTALLFDTSVTYAVPIDAPLIAGIGTRVVSGGNSLAAFPSLTSEGPEELIEIPAAGSVRIQLQSSGRFFATTEGRVLEPELRVAAHLIGSESVRAETEIETAGAYAGTSISARVLYRPIRGISLHARGGLFWGVDRLRPLGAVGIGVDL
jgi:hypothetical protein